jgi:preprotein translocase subunit SecG
MFITLMIVAILVGVFMTIVILMQSSKGQGLSGAFGGASGGVGTMLGVRRASDVLSKATWVLATAFVLLIFVINMFFLPTESTEESVIQRSAREHPISPLERQQQQGAQQQGAPQQGAPQQGAPQQGAPQQGAPQQGAPQQQAPQQAPAKGN